MPEVPPWCWARLSPWVLVLRTASRSSFCQTVSALSDELRGEPRRPETRGECIPCQAPNFARPHSRPEKPFHKIGNILVPELGEDRKKICGRKEALARIVLAELRDLRHGT